MALYRFYTYSVLVTHHLMQHLSLEFVIAQKYLEYNVNVLADAFVSKVHTAVLDIDVFAVAEKYRVVVVYNIGSFGFVHFLVLVVEYAIHYTNQLQFYFS